MRLLSVQGAWSSGKSTLIAELGKLIEPTSVVISEFGEPQRRLRDALNFEPPRDCRRLQFLRSRSHHGQYNIPKETPQLCA